MSYEKQIFSKGQVLKADDLNKMSEGIVSKCEIVDVDELPSTKGSWKGTTVPNTGYVEKVYINNQIPINEFVNILNSVTYTMTAAEIPAYLIVTDKDYSVPLVVMKMGEAIVLTSPSINFVFELVDNEWTITEGGELVSSIDINNEVVNEHAGVLAGLENDKLSSLFSTTPFEYVEPEVKKNIYRLSSYNAEMLLSEPALDMFGDNPFKVNYVNELPENTEGLTTNDAETTQFIVYYNKSTNDLYVYLDEGTAADIGMESGWTLAIPLLETAGFNLIYKGIIYNKSEADFTSTETDALNMYLLLTETNKYYLYDKEWVELIDNRTINEYLPKEKHLYCHSLHIGPSDASSDEFDIWFDYITEQQSLSNLIDGGGGLSNLFEGVANNQTELFFNAHGYYVDPETQEKIGVIGVCVFNTFNVCPIFNNGESGASLLWSLIGFIKRQIF